jgi:hypothetical protein
VCVVHFVILVILFQAHEVWRDEARALNIVLESGSPLALLRNLHNEGHPALWYLLLYVAHGIFQTKAVLAVLSLLIAEAAVFVFVAYAPFPRWQRVLFAFSHSPLYEYSIVCRNYGLAMLLAFVICVLYPRRFARPIAFFAAVALFANTTALCAVFATGITVLWLLEYVHLSLARGRESPAPERRQVVGVALAVVGIVASVLVFRADAETTCFHTAQYLSLKTAFAALVQHLSSPGAQLKDLFLLTGPLPVEIAIWGLTVYFVLRNPFIGLLFYGSVLVADLFAILLYPPEVRHKALLYLMTVVCLWLAAQQPARARPRWVSAVENQLAPLLAGLIPLMFAISVGHGWLALKYDHNTRLSGSKWLAQLIESQPRFKDAIVIGEPELRIEGLSYYVDNPIYQVREKRFSAKVSFSRLATGDVTLDSLVATSRELRAQHHRPVMLVLGPVLSPWGPFDFLHTTVKHFSYDPLQYERFRAATSWVGRMRNNVHQVFEPEEFDVYVLR